MLKSLDTISSCQYSFEQIQEKGLGLGGDDTGGQWCREREWKATYVTFWSFSLSRRTGIRYQEQLAHVNRIICRSYMRDPWTQIRLAVQKSKAMGETKVNSIWPCNPEMRKNNPVDLYPYNSRKSRPFSPQMLASNLFLRASSAQQTLSCLREATIVFSLGRFEDIIVTSSLFITI